VGDINLPTIVRKVSLQTLPDWRQRLSWRQSAIVPLSWRSQLASIFCYTCCLCPRLCAGGPK